MRSSVVFAVLVGCATEAQQPPSATPPIDPSTADFAGDFTGASRVVARSGATAAMASVHIDDDGAGGDGLISIQLAPSCILEASWQGRMFTSIVSSIAAVAPDQPCTLALDNGTTTFAVALGSLTITTTGVLELKLAGPASEFGGSPASGIVDYDLFAQH